MAASDADLTRLDAILKDRPIMDSLQDAFNKATPLAERVTNTLTLSGRKGIFPVSFGVNEGIFARNEKETFGDSQVDDPDLAEVTAKYIYALFEITGPVMSATRDSPGAFEDALALSLENTIDGVKLDMARQIIGDGTGVMAHVQSRTDTDTLVLDNPYGLTRYDSARPVRNIIRRNMAIDVIDVGDLPTITKHHSNSAITAVTHSATGTTIDLDTAEATGPADGDYVVRAGNYTREINGILGAVDTAGSYLNIARAGKDGWQGVLVDAAATDLNPDHLRDTVDTIVETSGKTPELIVCNFKQRRNLYNLFQPQVRFAAMQLPSGLRGQTDDGSREETLMFDDMPVLVERFFPPEHIGIINTQYWFHAVDKEVEWFRGQDGTVLHLFAKQDVYTAMLKTYRNFVCLYPATNALIYGLTE